MKKSVWAGFQHGMGIGGWLTNYKRFNVLPDKWKLPLTIGDFEHFDSYITEKDVRYIASLGMDHIRLGFDQIVMEEAPYVYRERTFRLLDNFIAWCEKYDIGVVLNMHKAIGNYCDVPSPVSLLDDDELQNRFAAFWVECERRWHGKPDLVFELLNEVVGRPDESVAKWNALAARTIEAVREINPGRRIVVGSVCGNSPDYLKNLQIFDDENVIYTFHFYFPHSFTHQRAVLWDQQLYYNRVMPYPGDIEYYRDCERTVWGNENAYPGVERMDIDMLRREMQGAFDFRKAHPDKVLWLGEFGTIRHTPIQYRENWMHDVILLAKEHGIPYCVWNYLSTPNDGNRFSLVDDDKRRIVSKKLAGIIAGKVRRFRRKEG